MTLPRDVAVILEVVISVIVVLVFIFEGTVEVIIEGFIEERVIEGVIDDGDRTVIVGGGVMGGVGGDVVTRMEHRTPIRTRGKI